MPCSGPQTDYSELIPLLCEAMQIVDSHGSLKRCGKILRKWWKNHKIKDSQRVRDLARKAKTEQEKERLLSRLTKYERSLLGLK